MQHLVQLAKICTEEEAADMLRFSFSDAFGVASARRLECIQAGDEKCAAFWSRVQICIERLDTSQSAATSACKADPEGKC